MAVAFKKLIVTSSGSTSVWTADDPKPERRDCVFFTFFFFTGGGSGIHWKKIDYLISSGLQMQCTQQWVSSVWKEIQLNHHQSIWYLRYLTWILQSPSPKEYYYLHYLGIISFFIPLGMLHYNTASLTLNGTSQSTSSLACWRYSSLSHVNQISWHTTRHSKSNIWNTIEQTSGRYGVTVTGNGWVDKWALKNPDFMCICLECGMCTVTYMTCTSHGKHPRIYIHIWWNNLTEKM